MTERRTISINNERVLDVVKQCKNVSRFFEEAALYYLDSIEEERINRETVKDIVLDVLKGIVSAGPITNPNYLDTKDKLLDDVMSIMDIE